HYFIFFFFFQAEDGIRDRNVTGVQTCALPILLTYLNEHKVPVVPYGGGSGVTGGAEPKKESVVIDVSNMKKIIHLDEDNLTVTAQSGVILRDLETYLKQNN